jgi:hypothetical protein
VKGCFPCGAPHPAKRQTGAASHLSERQLEPGCGVLPRKEVAEGVDVGVGEGLVGGGRLVVPVDVVGGFLPPAEGRDEGGDLTGGQLGRKWTHRSRCEWFRGGQLSGGRAQEAALVGLFKSGVGLDVRARDHAGERVSVGVDRDGMGIVGENVSVDDYQIEIGVVGMDGVDEPVADDDRHR